MNLRLLLAAAASAALMSTSAQAANIFFQSFTEGLGANESVGGAFAAMNGRVGHTDGPYYSNYEYSFYQLSLDLTDYLDAYVLFDYDIVSESGYDGFNVVASTTGVFDPPMGLLTPITGDVYRTMNNNLSSLGTQAVSGQRKGTAMLDLSPFAGGTVNLRFQFQSDYGVIARGLLLDNIIVSGEPIQAAVPEPATWAMMILGFGAAGSVLRRRRRLLPA